MRPIKFRVWIDYVGAFDYSDAYDTLGEFFNSNYSYDTANNILCQFTGLKDSNGEDIYEGDIVRASGNNKKYAIKFGGYEFGDVEDEWHHGWYLQRIDIDFSEPIGSQEEAKKLLTIIGNIYQIPELLNKYDK